MIPPTQNCVLVGWIWVLLWFGNLAHGIQLVVDDENSVKAAVNTAAHNALAFYLNPAGEITSQIPGICVQPYYWWQCGGLMGLLIQRWSITGNDSLNEMISQAIQWQVGDAKDFTPNNQSKDLGNDDQAYWGFTALDAAELGFPNPPASQPQWLALAQAVHHDQADVWDSETCGGGMRWQIYYWLNGWDYKNTQANGAFFQTSARLARYTGNQTYAEYAEKVWDWMNTTNILDRSQPDSLQVGDGVHVENCSVVQTTPWTYNPGTLISGAGYMYNYTNGSDIWRDRLTLLLNGMDTYFVKSAGSDNTTGKPAPENGTIMVEPSVEYNPRPTKDQDQPAFKGFTSRWLAITTQMAPFTGAFIWPRLIDSAMAAAGQCTGTAFIQVNQQPGTSCGRKWYQTTWDGYSGLGEHMSALSIFQSMLINNTKPPLTAMGGGISIGNPDAGGYGDGRNTGPGPLTFVNFTDAGLYKVIGNGDRVGAGIVTAVMIIGTIAGVIWIGKGNK